MLKKELEKYFDRLWGLNRSLTGNGNRETLRILSEVADIEVTEIPSGTECFDWTVPPEWNVKEAWVKDSKGKKVIDFASNNLHLLGYSERFSGKMRLKELKEHLYSLPSQPDAIPYLTSYYKRRWGFCVSHNHFKKLRNCEYEVNIDSDLDEKGSMSIGECMLHGSSDREVLLSTYICHPSMANNELSGPLVTAFIFRELKKRKDRKFTYRFLFAPETIGAIYFLSKSGNRMKEKLEAGYVVTCIGDKGKFTYKKSRRGDTIADRAALHALDESGLKYRTEEFFPTGSDERQYCSPGFNLPVGSLMRTRYGKYKEYHTSLDNRKFISFEAMQESVEMYLKVIDIIEGNDICINKMPYCEPQLGKRNLYPTIGSSKDTGKAVDALMWVLNMSDGENDLLSISRKSGISFDKIRSAATSLTESSLLERKNMIS